MTCKYSFSSFHWQMVSKDAKDLITRFLVADPNQRLNLHDALDHTWFSKRHQKPATTISKRNSSGPVLF
jgi:serine/threonine protein kinase